METADGFLRMQWDASQPALTYWLFVPRTARPAGTLVLIHGSQRNAGRMFRAFLPAAMALDITLLVPLFGVSSFRGYQRLNGSAGPMSARGALESTLADAQNHFGVSTDRVALCGFSGGAQFAHRFALFTPHRVRRLVVASAGYYTYLDARRPYPYGIRPSALSTGLRPDVDAFLRLPLHVLVGELDVEPDHAPGHDRLTRALRWVDHLESVTSARHRPSKVSFDLLPGTAHSFTSAVHRGDLVTRVLAFIHPSGAAPGAALTVNGVRS